MIGNSPHLRDQLLGHAQTICENLFVITENNGGDVVWWANTRDFQPGIGISAQLDRPIRAEGFQVKSANLVTYGPNGEAALTVYTDQPPALLDRDPFARYIHQVFSRHIGERAVGLAGKGYAMNHHTEIEPARVIFTESKTSAEATLL